MPHASLVKPLLAALAAVGAAAAIVGPSAFAASTAPVPLPRPLQPCRTSQLSLRAERPQAGAGNRYQELRFSNDSSAPCWMYGYVDIQNYLGGTPQPTDVVRDGGYFPSLKPVLFTLQPGQAAPFWIHYSVVPQGPGNDCPMVDALVVTPPGETEGIRIPDTLGPVCGRGELDISPVMPPGTVYP